MNRKLRRLLEENNSKSPEVHSITLTATCMHDAIMVAEVFEQVRQEDLPPQFHDWWKTISPPVELYFVFKTERLKNRFLKRVYTEIGFKKGGS